MENKIYTAQEMRKMAGFVYCPNNEQEKVVTAMLCQAAEMRERADAVLAKAKKANETQMSFGCHSCVDNYIKEINYILCGDAKNENK